MSLESERKFLMKGEEWRGLAEPVRIRQGYVATQDGSTVRAGYGYALQRCSSRPLSVAARP